MKTFLAVTALILSGTVQAQQSMNYADSPMNFTITAARTITIALKTLTTAVQITMRLMQPMTVEEIALAMRCFPLKVS